MSHEVMGLVLLYMPVGVGGPLVSPWTVPTRTQSLPPVLEEFPTRKGHALPAFLSMADILTLSSK